MNNLILLIIGAQKAGTTTLFDLLTLSPGFCKSKSKEVGYFTKDVFYLKGESWYCNQFDESASGTLKYEATPEYLYYPYAPQRISKFGQAVKFIVLLRDPASRCYSAWNMFREFNKNPSLANAVYEQFTKYSNSPSREAVANLLFTSSYPSFSSAVVDDIDRYIGKSKVLEPSFVRRGLYVQQIKEYLRYFSLDQFYFIEQSELINYRLLAERLSIFLGLPVSLPSSVPVKNAGEYQPIDEDTSETISRLNNFYKPYNEELFQLIGRNFDWGS